MANIISSIYRSTRNVLERITKPLCQFFKLPVTQIYHTHKGKLSSTSSPGHKINLFVTSWAPQFYSLSTRIFGLFRGKK